MAPQLLVGNGLRLKEVKARTQNLDDQFNKSLGKYVDIGRFPWLEEPIATPDAAIPRNPFIGYYPLTFDRKDGRPPNYSLFKAPYYVLPKKCTMEHFQGNCIKQPIVIPTISVYKHHRYWPKGGGS